MKTNSHHTHNQARSTWKYIVFEPTYIYEKKNVSACDRRKPDGCNPKNDFI